MADLAAEARVLALMGELDDRRRAEPLRDEPHPCAPGYEEYAATRPTLKAMLS